MASDRNFYYDFSLEQKLDTWEIIRKNGEDFLLETTLETDGGNFVILFPARMIYDRFNPYPSVQSIEVNGKQYTIEDAVGNYVAEHCARYGIRVMLPKGKTILKLNLKALTDDPRNDLFMNLIPDLPEVSRKREKRTFTLPEEQIPEAAPSYPVSGMTPGAGTVNSPGRFGFSKGDGVLDCAMSSLGVIDKMYLCGHPRYKKPFKWTYSTLPEGAELHGSFAPARKSPEQDSIAVNHLSVQWSAKFGTTDFSCTYSLASPGILTESSANSMRLSMLEHAGNYQYFLLPHGEEIEIMPLETETELKMTENWILLFGSTEFPDLPLLIVLDRPTEKMEVRRNPETGRLTEIIFHGNPRMITATPFGLESPQPISPEDTDRLADAVRRCRFWSRAFLCYPVRCEEYFKTDRREKTVTIVQKFHYRTLSDAWGTKPLKTAPLPPMLSLSDETIQSEAVTDFRFPTKYGYLRGVAGGGMSSYRIPFMPTARRFPLKDAGDSSISDLLQDGMREYFDFTAQFSQYEQAYPYAGALMEPFAFSTTMMNFMGEKDREHLRALAEERFAGACEKERQYDYPVIFHGEMMRTMPDREQVLRMYRSPEMKHMKLWNWYERTEPFTGVRYHICYLNVGFFSSGAIKTGTQKEISELKIPLVENDWGAGLTFYYMDLCMLASGSAEPAKKNWELLKSVYSFFDKMHDWACMGTGYSDNAITWVEGANYGVFTGFLHLAEAVGDKDAEERGIYLAAKQFALRKAVLRSGQHYLHRWYGVTPWLINKFFHEEAAPHFQFQNVPKGLWGGIIRDDGFYNLTTEGLYPEIFEGFQHSFPEEYPQIREQFRSALFSGGAAPSDNRWGKMQQTTTLLISEALDDHCPPEQVLRDLESAEAEGTLTGEWRGIHIFSRILPKNYFKSQILAWLAMRNHPLWLEHWENLILLSAEWDRGCARISFRRKNRSMKLRCGIRQSPTEANLNGKKIPFEVSYCGKLLEFHPEEDGILEIRF